MSRKTQDGKKSRVRKQAKAQEQSVDIATAPLDMQVMERKRIANNAVLFLDGARPSAVGQDGRQRMNEYMLCLTLMEDIAVGNLVAVPTTAVPELNSQSGA